MIQTRQFAISVIQNEILASKKKYYMPRLTGEIVALLLALQTLNFLLEYVYENTTAEFVIKSLF